MSYQFSIPTFWQRWHPEHPRLPSHLPRLLLNQRYQPRFVRRCQTTQSATALLPLLDWEQLPTTLAGKRTDWRTFSSLCWRFFGEVRPSNHHL
jgi:hypothetical protein